MVTGHQRSRSTIVDQIRTTRILRLCNSSLATTGRKRIEFETLLFEATGQCRRTFTDMEKNRYYIHSLKSSIHEEMLEELQSIPPNVCSNLFEIRWIAATKGHSQCTSVKHAQMCQAISTSTSKKDLFKSMLCDIMDPPSAGSSLPRKQGMESHLHPQGTVQVVLKPETLLLLNFIPTTNDIHKSL